MGNIKQTPFNEIWNGQDYERIRRLLLEGQQEELPLCKNCYQLPIEVTIAVNIFIQYILKTKGKSSLDSLSNSLIKFLEEFSDVYNNGNIDRYSFKELLEREKSTGNMILKSKKTLANEKV